MILYDTKIDRLMGYRNYTFMVPTNVDDPLGLESLVKGHDCTITRAEGAWTNAAGEVEWDLVYRVEHGAPVFPIELFNQVVDFCRDNGQSAFYMVWPNGDAEVVYV